MRIAADGSTQPEKIPTGDIKVTSNDHILSPDGKTIYITAKSHLYALPFEGGTPKRISNEHPAAMGFKYFLHGITPDGKTLAYVGVSKVGDDPWGRSDSRHYSRRWWPRHTPDRYARARRRARVIRPMESGSTSTPNSTPGCPATRSVTA